MRQIIGMAPGRPARTLSNRARHSWMSWAVVDEDRHGAWADTIESLTCLFTTVSTINLGSTTSGCTSHLRT
eukprot:9063212-Alexandrium_andersonii.AAC.1